MRSAQQLKSDIPPPTPPHSTLLSQLLVAFTIEFDNEFEHRMPHRTTSFSSAGERVHGAWLGSMVLWENAMRLVPDAGITVGEVELEALLQKAGFANVQTDLVHKETEAPYFQTLLAVGDKLIQRG